jgi:hypothetical protein
MQSTGYTCVVSTYLVALWKARFDDSAGLFLRRFIHTAWVSGDDDDATCDPRNKETQQDTMPAVISNHYCCCVLRLAV